MSLSIQDYANVAQAIKDLQFLADTKQWLEMQADNQYLVRSKAYCDVYGKMCVRLGKYGEWLRQHRLVNKDFNCY